MPLPKPLAKSAPKAKKKTVMAATMHDLKHGEHHGERTHEQEVAIGMKQSGQSKKQPKTANAMAGLGKGPKQARIRQAKDAKRLTRASGRK